MPNRRDALKALAATAGATTLATLPEKWTTPVVRVGVLPAHAQTSCDFLNLTLSWDDAYDLNLMITEPSGFNVHPTIGDGGTSPTTGATHSGDATGGTNSVESISIPLCGPLADPGSYHISIRRTASSPQVPVTLTLETNCGSQTRSFDVGALNTSITDVVFPGGCFFPF